MRKRVNRSQSGMILLSMIIMLLIVSSFAAMSMTTSALEVHSGKGHRVQDELKTVADAVRRYGEDVLRAQYYDSTLPTPGPHYIVFPTSLANLIQVPTAINNAPTPPIAPVWKGPYLESSPTNTSQQSVLQIVGTNILDAWGSAYSISAPLGTTGQNSLRVRVTSLGANRDTNANTASDDDLEMIVDLNGYARRVTSERIAVIEDVLPPAGNLAQSAAWPMLTINATTTSAFNNANPFFTLNATNNTYEVPFSNYLPTFVTATLLPNSPIYYSDAWGSQLLGVATAANFLVYAGSGSTYGGHWGGATSSSPSLHRPTPGFTWVGGPTEYCGGCADEGGTDGSFRNQHRILLTNIRSPNM